MSTYRVVWEIDLDADTPLEAARKAHTIQLDPSSLAVVYHILNQDNILETVIDLLETDGMP